MSNKKPAILRCIHRHTIDSHPSCFAQGLINYKFKDDREFERIAGVPWYQYKDYKIGYLDIETDNLKADFGTMLTWSLKLRGGEVAFDFVTKEELFEGKGDIRIVKSLLNEISKYKILVTYYGTGFDIPFIRSKALRYGLQFPGYVLEQKQSGSYYSVPEIYHFDLYYTVKSKLQLSRNSLSVVTAYLGIDGKTPILAEDWASAKYGDKKAMKNVLAHNIADVEILEELHDKLMPFRTWTRRGL